MAPSAAASELLGAEHSYYEVLGVPFEASEEDIRKVYHGIVRTLHPDRRRPGSSGGEALDRFHQVQSAWRCLSDPTRRLLYDLRNFGRSSLAAETVGLEATSEGLTAEEKLVHLQKEQAVRDISNMEVVLQKVLRRERATRGVIVRSAMYGDLRLREESFAEGLAGVRTIEEKDLVGPVVDVAVPLQCLVEQHTIVLPGGSWASKADLPGFYNPAPLDTEMELSLYVLYEFKGHLHEVIVGDRETLSLPYRKHAVPAGKAPRGPFSSANVVRLQCRTAADDVGIAGATAAGEGKSREQARSRAVGSRSSGAAEALQRAVTAYTLQRLRSHEQGDVTRREFLAVALGTVGALMLAANAINQALPRADRHPWAGNAVGAGVAVALAGLWKVCKSTAE